MTCLQTSTNMNQLHNACERGDLEEVTSLVSKKECDINALNTDGESPLHIACEYGHLKIVKVLLKNQKCNLNTQNMNGNTPLHLACYKKLLHIIRVLLERRCRTNIPNKRVVLAQCIHLNEDGDCLLHIACRWGDVDIVKYLITDERCNPSVQSSTSENTPLHIAAKYGQNSAIFQLLLCKQCSPNVQNKDGDTPLHIAARRNKTVAISELFAHQHCNPNVQNNVGDTPLHSIIKSDVPLHNALVKNRQKKIATIFQLLAHEQCDQKIKNRDGDTPLHIAVKNTTPMISKLLANEQCNPNVQNKDGDTPLHIAVLDSITPLISHLLSNKKCNPNVQNKDGNTPLHIAVNLDNVTPVMSQLLSNKKCNPNVQNKDGNTPLHIAVLDYMQLYMKSAISQLLTNKQCNPSVQNDEGDTPLHIACCRKLFGIIKLLLQNKSSTNIPNKKGETAQDIPLTKDGDSLLHIACQWYDMDIVKYLITDERCSPNVQNSASGNTPLHIAAKYGQNDTIAELLSYKECDPNAQNKEGDTPLHFAVRQSKSAAISQLLAHQQCNPNVQDKEGDTPLHIAVKENIIPAISQLLTCNPNVLNNDHLTPLLTAIKHNNLNAATAVLQHHKCDPTLRDPHGNTPLHLACIAGETQPNMVELAKQLLSSVNVDPSCVNNAGQTPIELTTNYQLIQAISHMVQCKTKQSVQTYINMFIVGNPETGKSTLVKAICKEATSILWKIAPKWLRRVKNVPLHTAGIIPTTFRSKTFGNTVLHDLAGQVEYYTSHAAVIRSTVISTPPAFIVVVNLSESEEKISQTLRYWWSFIDNHAARYSALPQVILVGSHADVVKSTGESIQEKIIQMSALLKKLSASFHFAGQVALDCRDPASRQLQLLCSLVNQSCTALRQTADVDLRCHVLYAFLLDKFKGKVACMVSDVAASIKETSALLPQKLDSLISLISTLSDKGLLLLVKGGESHEGWWVILQKQALLSEMNGVIFAPKSFRQHKDLSWSTGVVPFLKLKNEFPDYNPIMVSGFLTHLEFCFKIEDYVTLALLKDEATNVDDTSPDVLEEYYFFPALVSVENPLHMWEQNEDMCIKCGWLYQCIQPDQFLTTQFLHVLILRLAFIFALQLDPGDCRKDSLFIRRKCSVWKHGVGWLNWEPIETVVEVGLQYQSVIVMMCCPKGKEAECVQLRSQVIQKVLEVKDEHCKAVKMSESFTHPTDVNYPFTHDNTENVKCYSLTGIARMIARRAVNVLDQRGRNPVPVQDLLLFDPYSTDNSTETSPELLRELFSEKHSIDEAVRSQALVTLNSESEK